jgi:hypothetical protein
MKYRPIKTVLFTLSILLCLSSAITHARIQEGETFISFETILRNPESRIRQMKNLVITNTTDWQKPWKKIGYSAEVWTLFAK